MNERNASIPGEPEDVATGLLPHFLIELGAETYALPQTGDAVLSWVQRPQDPTYLPTLPPWCLGLVNQRNNPVLLVDLGALLGMPPAPARGGTGDARHIFIERNADVLGFVVDRTRRFRALPPSALPADGAFIVGVQRVGDTSVGILNIDAIWRHILEHLGSPVGQV